MMDIEKNSRRLTSFERFGSLVSGMLLLLVLAIPISLPRRTTPGDQYLGVHTLRADGRTMSLARDAGVGWLVQLISWREVETSKGQFFWEYPDSVVRAANFYGLNLVLRVDQQPAWARATTVNAPPDSLDDYGDFLFALARRYRGKVKAYIVWNEPNLAVEWGGRAPDPEAYAAMLKVAYPRLKQGDPQALVVSAGLASTNEQDLSGMDERLFLRRVYDAGARGYFDVLGAHPYGFGYPPDDPRGAHDGLNLRRLMDLRDILQENGDGAKQIWATEFGWTTGTRNAAEAWKVVTERQQAEYLREAVILARKEWPWLGLMAVWNLSAGPSDGDDFQGYSLLNSDYTPRLSFLALQDLCRKTTSLN